MEIYTSDTPVVVAVVDSGVAIDHPDIYHNIHFNDSEVENGFMTKVGWRDDNSEKLVERKRSGGFSDRDDIQTNFDFHDADEGRI